MTCIRSVLAYGHLSGGETSQADAEQAFIQPLLDESVHMYIFVPPEMQTIEMKQNCKNVFNPVFRLRRPLYGWSRSGNIWESHLANTLQNIKHDKKNGNDNWKAVEHWPQTFWKIGSKGKPVILTVYVDDFVLAGPGSSNEWDSILKAIRTTVPEPVKRILGVHHTFNKKGDTITTEIDMVDYVKQPVQLYNDTDKKNLCSDQTKRFLSVVRTLYKRK